MEEQPQRGSCPVCRCAVHAMPHIMVCTRPSHCTAAISRTECQTTAGAYLGEDQELAIASYYGKELFVGCPAHGSNTKVEGPDAFYVGCPKVVHDEVAHREGDAHAVVCSQVLDADSTALDLKGHGESDLRRPHRPTEELNDDEGRWICKEAEYRRTGPAQRTTCVVPSAVSGRPSSRRQACQPSTVDTMRLSPHAHASASASAMGVCHQQR